MIKDIGIYFLYRHIRLDKNEPFYIGIGTKRMDIKNPKNEEVLYRRAYSKRGRCIYWRNIVAKTDYRVEILLESNDNKFIKQKEIEFIRLYGRKDLKTGTLVNKADGGQGVTGKIFSELERKRLSDRMKGNQFWIKSVEITKKLLSKPVYQYDFDSLKFIKKWDSCRQAADFLKIKDSSGLSSAARKNKRYHNFIWSYNYEGEINLNFNCNQYNTVIGKNIETNEILYFSSLNAALRHLKNTCNERKNLYQSWFSVLVKEKKIFENNFIYEIIKKGENNKHC